MHFLILSSCGHIMPYSLGDTTTSRFIVSRPPHAYGSGWGHVSSQVIGAPVTPMQIPSLGYQSVKSQSLIFDGGDTVLSHMIWFRTVRTPQILVKRISVHAALNSAIFLSYSCWRSRFS